MRASSVTSGKITYFNGTDGTLDQAAAIAYATSAVHLKATAQAATDVPLVAKGAGSQSADLQQWQNSSGTAISYMTSGGILYASGGFVSTAGFYNTYSSYGFRWLDTNGERYACGQVIDFWGGGSEFEKLPGFIQDAMAPMTTENLRHWDICTEPQHSADDLRGMNVPTRVVCGRRSNAVAHAIADHLVETLPTARKFEVDDASHAMVTSHAQASLDILLTPVV